mgnify:CR=1 FL=1
MKKNVRRLGAAFGVVMTSVMMSLSASAGDVTTDRLVNSEKEPGNWLNHHGNLEAHRFSGLDQINTKNIKNLKVAFTWAGVTMPCNNQLAMCWLEMRRVARSSIRPMLLMSGTLEQPTP